MKTPSSSGLQPQNSSLSSSVSGNVAKQEPPNGTNDSRWIDPTVDLVDEAPPTQGQQGENGDELLDFVRDNRLSLYWDTLHEVWIVQKPFQVDGNIGKSRSIRDAIQQAQAAPAVLAPKAAKPDSADATTLSTRGQPIAETDRPLCERAWQIKCNALRTRVEDEWQAVEDWLDYKSTRSVSEARYFAHRMANELNRLIQHLSEPVSGILAGQAATDELPPKQSGVAATSTEQPQEEEPVMKCFHCGWTTSDRFQDCVKCGFPLVTARSVAAAKTEMDLE